MRNRNAVVFSKDRPFQLEVFLLSFVRFALNYDLVVIYRCSPIYEKNYSDLIDKFPNVRFVAEVGSFNLTLKSTVGPLRWQDHITLFVDDNIICRKLNSARGYRFFEAYSHRLSTNITKSYPDNAEIDQPVVRKVGSKFQYWIWRRRDNPWYYFPSLDGDLMPVWLLKLATCFALKGPNSLERALNLISRLMPFKYYFGRNTSVIGIPHNIVQTEWNNSSECGNVIELNTKLVKWPEPLPTNLRKAKSTHIAYDYMEFIDDK